MKTSRYIVGLIAFGVCLCALGLALIIAGSLSFKSCDKESDGEKSSTASGGEHEEETDRCGPSDEATRVELYEHMEDIMNNYYAEYPNRIIWHFHAEGDDLKNFRPYNCSPEALKQRTDLATELYDTTKKLRAQINQSQLKPRELKALIQMLHFLKTDFGHPYGENYYSGDWMMGPSRFCSESMCRIGSDLYYHFNTKSWSWQPSTYDDVSYILEQVRGYKPMIEQYISNMKYGIAAGMARSTEQCEAGYYSFVGRFQKVSALGEKGILNEWFTKSLLSEEYYEKLNQTDKQKWEKDFGGNMTDSVETTLVEYFGRPLMKVLNFLENEYRPHCVSSNITSGLANLPLKYIYENGTRTGKPTTQKLPFGEKLNGSKAYERILYFFTTSEEYTPDRIHDLGQEKLKTLYAEAIKAAEKETGKSGKDAVDSFKKILNDQSSFFNDEKFPANESNKFAFSKCTSLEEAKTFCPKRYEAFQIWSAYVREILSLLDPKTIDMFHFSGEKRTTPNCPLKVVPNFNPKSGSQSFIGSGYLCTEPSSYRLPFFMDNLGPKYNAFSVAGHEGRPGHHTQIQGSFENFADGCGDIIDWMDSTGFYTIFSEGWALYAENPLLALDTDVYQDNPLQKYGMLKWQIWRAIRLIVDTGLHYKGMKRYEALEYHAKYAWDTTDKATKDVTRYQSNPGQATAYMLGQLEIWKLRNLTKQKLEEAGKEFSEKDFHYQVLSQGKSPIEYLNIHINKYIDCMISNSENCDALATGSNRDSSEETRRNRVNKKTFPNLNFRDLREHQD